MNRWSVIVPLKEEANRKTRLTSFLTANERCELTDTLFERVVAAIADCQSVRQVLLLAPRPPRRWSGAVLLDQNRGLNHELAEAARLLEERFVAVIHADLPQLTASDVDWLLRTADSHGGAVAPDRHGTGTNAIALQSAASFRFCFGKGSFDLHARQLPGESVVDRPGLSFDLDTPEDFSLAVAAGVIQVPKRCIVA
jgi:2-phospho-L-lactate guanylyltransferase